MKKAIIALALAFAPVAANAAEVSNMVCGKHAVSFYMDDLNVFKNITIDDVSYPYDPSISRQVGKGGKLITMLASGSAKDPREPMAVIGYKEGGAVQAFVYTNGKLVWTAYCRDAE